jgi:hypothetical protein
MLAGEYTDGHRGKRRCAEGDSALTGSGKTECSKNERAAGTETSTGSHFGYALRGLIAPSDTILASLLYLGASETVSPVATKPCMAMAILQSVCIHG